MKKLISRLAILAFISLPFYLAAQDEKPEKKEAPQKVEKKELEEKELKIEKKETQEIIIRNKGGKELNLKLEINGDKITVNGKPLAEFKDDGVSINKRRMMIRDRDDPRSFFGFDGESFAKNFMGKWNGNGQEVTRPFLGVTTEQVAEGAKIIEVVKESAAEKAGLKKGDVITKVGNETITDPDDLSEEIASKKPKETVTVAYLRNGKESNIKAILGERKIKAPLTYGYGSPRGKVKSFSIPKLDMMEGEGLNGLGSLAPAEGYNFSPFNQFDNTFSRQKKLGLKIQDTEEGGNVKVIEVEEGSAAEKAGLKKDDIITEIGGEKIENTDDAREQLMPSEAKTAYPIKAKRNGTEMSFEVKFPKKLKTANL
ncbi:MAG: PDZ domain-containing protein [Ferruginibacter sp.]